MNSFSCAVFARGTLGGIDKFLNGVILFFFRGILGGKGGREFGSWIF